ncbi:glycosyltransferase [Cetobacterium ceti]
MKFTLLMSVYIKEKSEYLNRALESVYGNTLLPNELVLVEDGPLSEELYEVIEKYSLKYKNIKRVRLEKNMGLGKALDIGLKYCGNNLVIRMDSDDICHGERFYKQVKFLKENPHVKILGCNLGEFKGDFNRIDRVKKYPENIENIDGFARKRCPFPHPGVAFYRDIVEEVGGYRDLFYFEDYYLFLRILKKYRGYNIQENLIYFRSDENLYKRRGGVFYVLCEYRAFKRFYKEGLIGLRDFLGNMGIRLGVRLMGNRFRQFVYERFLRCGEGK